MPDENDNYTPDQWWEDLGTHCSELMGFCLENDSEGSLDCGDCREFGSSVIESYIKLKAQSNRKDKDAKRTVSES